MEKKSIEIAINNILNSLVAFPSGQICKHFAMCYIIDELEKIGYNWDKKYVEAVVCAYDDESENFVTFEQKLAK